MQNFYTEHNLPKPVLPTCPIIQHLKGQKCLITGASSGIGKAIAIAMAHAGADVMVNYVASSRDADDTAVLADGCGSKVITCKANVSREEDVEAMFAQFIEAYGRIDILVSNAGIQRDAPFHEMTLDQWNQVIGTNLTGQFLCSRAAVRLFKKQGVNPDLSVAAGKIICMSSVHDIIPWAGHVNYASSKGGVMMMMKSLAQEMAPLRIRVNSISPGAIRTPINKEAWSTPEAYEGLMKLIPYKRIGEPDEIGRVAVWLASDESDYINGATIYVDGGMTLYPGFEAGG